LPENAAKVFDLTPASGLNNKEAKIQIGVSQPILSNTYTTTGTGTTTGVVEGTIEYKDVGIILSVTPRISDGGLVSLDIAVESSSVGTTQLGNLPSVPFFNKKTAKTTLAVIEGQTIVIGGLIEETKNYVEANFPGAHVRYGDTDSVMVEFDVQGRILIPEILKKIRRSRKRNCFSWQFG
jgi:general secretion pathway protein D